MAAPKKRTIRVVEFIAESQEQEAAKMPQGYADRAAMLRDSAEKYRALDDFRSVTIEEKG